MAKNTIRARRRNRWRNKAALAELDRKASERIHDSMLWSMDTWGGTRCGECGIAVRPHLLANLSRTGPGFHLTAFGTRCEKVANCAGPKPYWMEGVDDCELTQYKNRFKRAKKNAKGHRKRCTKRNRFR